MFNQERVAATARLDDAIHFKRKGGGYLYPDLLADSHALTLIHVRIKPTQSEDEILRQIGGRATVCFIEKETV